MMKQNLNTKNIKAGSISRFTPSSSTGFKKSSFEFHCPYKDCGRKFIAKSQLNSHIKRRHQIPKQELIQNKPPGESLAVDSSDLAKKEESKELNKNYHSQLIDQQRNQTQQKENNSMYQEFKKPTGRPQTARNQTLQQKDLRLQQKMKALEKLEAQLLTDFTQISGSKVMPATAAGGHHQNQFFSSLSSKYIGNQEKYRSEKNIQ